MPVNNPHPEHTERLGEWIQLRDTYLGEKAVKRKRVDYLPPTKAMVQDGMNQPTAPGWKNYDAYIMRAVFHDYMRDAVKAIVGIINMRDADIQLPAKLEPLRDRATVQGESLNMLLRRIHEMQLTLGRCGLLADAPTGVDVDKALPYLAMYEGDKIINWDAGRRDEGMDQLELLVLDESGPQRQGFIWKDLKKYRVLLRGDNAVFEGIDARPQPDDAFRVCVKVSYAQDGKEDEAAGLSDPTPQEFLVPSIGGRTLEEIPFVFINANDLVPETQVSPLLGLSNLALAIYRAEADYRQALHEQGQATLVIVGANASESDEEVRTGSSAVIDLRVGGSAEYIGAPATGLGEMRQSLQNDKATAATWGQNFLIADEGSTLSGEALRTRIAARTTTVADISRTGAAGLERSLKQIAVWMDADPDEVKVTPNTDFSDQSVAGAALLAFMQAKQLGLPLSLQSLHRSLRANDLTELSFEEEMEQIEAEAELFLNSMAGGMGGAPADGQEMDAQGNVLPAQTTPPVKPGEQVPITPHTRGAPAPSKKKVGDKGASNKGIK